MNLQTVTIEKICSQRNDLAAYIDGELSAREELELEMHIAICGDCNSELNEQKNLLQALDFALETEREIKLPANFTKIVVANAECKVSGLRRPQERFRALFVCAALFTLVILGLGGETRTVFGTFTKFAEQFLAVGGFVWNIVYDIAFGTAIILRSLSNQFVYNSTVFLAFICGLFFVLLFVFSRLTVRTNRA